MPTTRLAVAKVGLYAQPATQLAMATAVFASKARLGNRRRRGQPEIAFVNLGAGYWLRGHDRTRRRGRGRRAADVVALDGDTREVCVIVEVPSAAPAEAHASAPLTGAR